MTETIICKSCNNKFSGKFCNECGEKVYTDHDKTLAHFFEEALHFITHFDSKFLRTLRLVFFKPGFVSKEISQGVRKKYFKPLSLFLLGVVIYLLFPVLRGLNIRFESHLGQYNAMQFHLPEQWVYAKMASMHITDIEVFGELFEKKSEKVSKLLLLVIVPMLAGWLSLVFRRKKRFFFDHLTLAAEISSFYLYFVFLSIPLVMTIVYGIGSWFGGLHTRYGDSLFFTGMIVIVLLSFVAAAFKRFYGLKTGHAILKSLLFLAGFYAIIYILYRLILFCIVMLLI